MSATHTFNSDDPTSPKALVVVRDTVIVVIAGPSRDPGYSDIGEIFAIDAEPPWWSHGAGRLLMVNPRSLLVKMEFKASILWVLEKNFRVRRFYDIDNWWTDGEVRVENVKGFDANVVRYHRQLLAP